ncbi:hypothetical protein [Spirosoma foliorum]|uniref:Uncharacterized protein n=1 Tax=Spirosoma foliorum TaxID=2710596 RepID=A0A7G5H182_9BACT|nr:hypothetical protein [Spirosoma foliorum]QMW04874.1 hypothetical protein H3H32_08175 [Spirosoma foliorum]
MSEATYTSIPDTSDTFYWESKSEQGITKFIPRDKALHHQLKLKAWNSIQAALPLKNRKGSGY